MNRREVGWAAGAGAGIVLVYAAAIEPFAIETVRIEIRVPRLPPAFDGFTIYQISDLHTSKMGRRERMVAALLKRLPPADIVAVTGDLVHTTDGIPAYFEMSKALSTREGTFVVYGNSEHKNGILPRRLCEALIDAGQQPLVNTHVIISRGDQRLAIVGVDDPVNEVDNLEEALSGLPKDICKIALMHSPDGIAEAVVRDVDLVLSGHTHGGQIALPLHGALMTNTFLGRRLTAGYSSGKRLRKVIGIRPGRTQLYVSRGIGISGVALRFFARPEFTILTLRRGIPGATRR
jgi:predicted MPP superfamily phosphohydrolase